MTRRLDALAQERGQLQATVGTIQGERSAERQRLEEDLEVERGRAKELADRLSKLEANVADRNRHLDEAQQAAGRSRARTRFCMFFIFLACLLAGAGWGAAFGIHKWLAYSQLKGSLLSGGAALAGWLTVLLLIGRAKEEVRTWSIFQAVDRAIVWLRNTAWVLALGLLTNLVWELAK